MVKIHVVYGSPASGKTTYVKKEMGDNDLMYDFDDLMKSISGKPYQQVNKQLMSYVLGIRDLILVKLRAETTIDNAYIITSFLTDDLVRKLKGLSVNYIKMDTDPQVCISRVTNSSRIDKDRVHDVIYEWYNKYTEPIGYQTEVEKKKFYNSSAWNQLRKQVLQRDNNECQICKQYGKLTVDSTKVDGERKQIVLNVHHKLELARFPQYALDINNLIAICVPCHNRIHKKQIGVKKELKWKDERW